MHTSGVQFWSILIIRDGYHQNILDGVGLLNTLTEFDGVRRKSYPDKNYHQVASFTVLSTWYVYAFLETLFDTIIKNTFSFRGSV